MSDIEHEMRIARVPQKFITASLDDTTLDKKIVDGLMSYALEPSGFCALSGGVGTGKTFAAAATIRAALTHGKCRSFDRIYADIRFISEADYLDALKASFRDGWMALRYDNMPGQPWLLALDDLGSACTSEWAKVEMAKLIDVRYREELPTIVTTNHTMSTLANVIDARTVSRVIESNRLFRFGNVDLRLQQKGQNDEQRTDS